MQSKAEKEMYLNMIEHGHLDIIVGTHSLLGNRVVYNNLGLLVVDEEQVCLLSPKHISVMCNDLCLVDLHYYILLKN
jgi:primosomal protein N'